MKKAYQDVFKRYEKKYMLSRTQYTDLRRAMEGRMQQDQYGLHTICNLYFDTESFSLIRTSLDKPVYKEKLRLRSYGIPGANDPVFAELKKKFDGVVYKRRVSMTLNEAYHYLYSGIQPAEDSQIIHELNWFLAHNDVSPKAYIAYDRIALFGLDDPELRVTFDAGIRWRDSNLDLSCGDQGYRLTRPGNILMELKLPGAMPLWLSHALADCGATPTSFSKYGTCYKEHLCAAAQKGVFVCA